MIKSLQIAIAGLLWGGGLLLSAGCTGVAYTGRPPGLYDYDYYPDWDVYYYPEGRIYYWNDDGHWRSGPEVPHWYHLHSEGREHLQLHTRRPWTEHHEESHGPQHYPEHGGRGHGHDDD